MSEEGGGAGGGGDANAGAAGGDAQKPSPADAGKQSANDGGKTDGDGKKEAAEGDKAQSAPDSAEKAASIATSRAGGGSARGESLSDAESAMHGDVVNQKNVFFVGGERKQPPQRLSPDLEDPVNAAFVEPPDWDEISAEFFNHRTVIVRGPEGCGKTTAAIRLLLRSGKVYHLDSEIDLNKLAESIGKDGSADGGIERDARFLLVRPEKFPELRASSLQRIDDALQRADARLALIIDGQSPRESDLLPYTVTLSAPPKHPDVLASHLRWRLGDSLGELVLEREDVRGLVDRLLPRANSCSRVARLAELVARDYEIHGHVDAERISKRMAQREAEEFDIWFASLDDAETRCFAVALAVLGGLAYERVSAAARSLHGRIERPQTMVVSSAGEGPYDGAGPFRTDRAERERRLAAKAERVDVRGDFGRSKTDVIAYRDAQNRPREVLRHVWSQYQIQQELVDWLDSLAADGALPVRIRAGLALGQIAAQSFDYICERVLAPWAAGATAVRWDAVAYALREVTYSAPELIANVRSLTKGWYGNTDSRYAQATAARVHGVCLGRFDPESAVDALERLLASGDEEISEDEDISVAGAIGDSLADLVFNGTPELAEYVLAALGRAVDDRRRTASAQLAFLILAVSLNARMSDETTARDDWPYLLCVAQQNKELREPLAALWRRTVKESRFHVLAEAVMTAWARSAESDEELRDLFLRLLRSMARGDRRCAQILETYARRWTAPENIRPLPKVATAVRAIIAAEKGLAQ